MNDRNAIKAGLFILVTVALIVGVIIAISGFDQLVEPRQHFIADFKLADDLGGLAPALVVTAGFDPLRDDGSAYADALRAAGVEVEYRCYDDQIHGFMGMGILDDSLALATEVCDAMGRLMRRASRSLERSGD